MGDGTLFGRLDRLNIVDLFCGAGGTSLGVQQALGYSPEAAINHWPYAIRVHAQNHPDTLHFEEDIFQVAPWEAARGKRVDLLVGSPSCVHFSVAKGSAPKDAGIRSQAEVFIRWAREIKPRVILLENVKEFLSWGPINEDGHPIQAQAGESFKGWVQALEAEGYRVGWKLLKACDFGAPTSRLRLFVVARCDDQPIRWPEPSHGHGKLPYRTAAECIDWSIPCPSIFERKKPLAEATLKRIAAGIQKYVLTTAQPFLLCKSHGGRLEPLDRPLNTVTAGPKGGDRLLVAPSLIQMGYGEREGQPLRTLNLHKPLGTVVSGGNKFGLVAAFLAKHYTGAIGSDLRSPLSTVTTQDHHSLVAAFMTKFYGAGGTAQGIGAPLDTATTKARFGLVTVTLDGEPYVLSDIGMRMLAPRELARAQGFPDSYIFEGTKADQIAAIGNAVVPQVMAALVRANLEAQG